MTKLPIITLMNLTEKIEKQNWLNILISLNNSGKLEEFLRSIDKMEILKDTIKSESNQKKH